jgi:hypothetical protein
MPVHMGVMCDRCRKVHFIATSPALNSARQPATIGSCASLHAPKPGCFEKTKCDPTGCRMRRSEEGTPRKESTNRCRASQTRVLGSIQEQVRKCYRGAGTEVNAKHSVATRGRRETPRRRLAVHHFPCGKRMLLNPYLPNGPSTTSRYGHRLPNLVGRYRFQAKGVFVKRCSENRGGEWLIRAGRPDVSLRYQLWRFTMKTIPKAKTRRAKAKPLRKPTKSGKRPKHGRQAILENVLELTESALPKDDKNEVMRPRRR